KVLSFAKRSVLYAYPNIFKTIKTVQPDIVFTSAGHLTTPISMFTATSSYKFVHIASLPSLPSNKLATTLKSKILSNATVFAYRRADFVIAQTNQMRDEVINILGVSPYKTIVIPNIVNIQQILSLAGFENELFDQNKFNIIAVGTLYSV